MNDGMFASYVNTLGNTLANPLGWMGDGAVNTGRLIDDLGDALLTSDGDTLVYAE